MNTEKTEDTQLPIQKPKKCKYCDELATSEHNGRYMCDKHNPMSYN